MYTLTNAVTVIHTIFHTVLSVMHQPDDHGHVHSAEKQYVETAWTHVNCVQKEISAQDAWKHTSTIA